MDRFTVTYRVLADDRADAEARAALPARVSAPKGCES